MVRLTCKHATKVLSIPVHDLDSIPGIPACPQQLSLWNFITTVLTPAKSIPHPACSHPLPSDGRGTSGRIIRRLADKAATELAGKSSAIPEPDCSCSFSCPPSPLATARSRRSEDGGEKVRLRAVQVNQLCLWVSLNVRPHPGPLLQERENRPPTHRTTRN
jgi:hypothetical protein